MQVLSVVFQILVRTVRAEIQTLSTREKKVRAENQKRVKSKEKNLKKSPKIINVIYIKYIDQKINT